MVKATSISGSFPINFTRMVEPVEGGARVSAIIERDAGGFSSWPSLYWRTWCRDRLTAIT
jgi:hypothetical protein